MSYALVDWSMVKFAFVVRDTDGRLEYARKAEDILKVAFGINRQVRVNEEMPAEKLIEVIAAAIYSRKTLLNMGGKEITETPVPDANVKYVTRQQIGAVLPEGWFIEVQLNRYSACFGESLSLPARKSMSAAILDIHEFLSMSIKQATDDLIESVRARRASAEGEQLPMWPSSDRATPAVDASTELDGIA